MVLDGSTSLNQRVGRVTSVNGVESRGPAGRDPSPGETDASSGSPFGFAVVVTPQVAIRVLSPLLPLLTALRAPGRGKG